MLDDLIQGFRLSPQQEHIWILRRPDSDPFRSACAIFIDGPLDFDTLKAALVDVLDRHPILRSGFRLLPAMTVPLMVIEESAQRDLDFCSLSRLTPRDQPARIDELFSQACRAVPADEAAPEMKASLLQLSPLSHCLIISLPALCADRVGLANLTSHLASSYSALSDSQPLPDPAVQYADLAEWLNDLLESSDTHAGRLFWSQKDFSSLPKLDLAADSASSDVQDFTPLVLTRSLSAETSAACLSAASRLDTSPERFLLACFQTLLWSHTNVSPLSVGVCFDGRKYDELKTEIGPLARHLPIEVTPRGAATFSSLLEQVNEATQAAFKWQEYFCWQHLTSSNEPAYARFAFEYFQAPEAQRAGEVSFRLMNEYACTDRYKLKLVCRREGGQVELQWHFDSSLYGEQQIERIADDFVALIKSVTADPDVRLDEVEAVGEQSRARILTEFNNTQKVYPGSDCLHELFERQAELTPDEVAIVFGDEMLSYSELDRRANQLARYLMSKGVGLEARVGLCVERSLEMVVGMLGILKAGAAYVPMDPSYPKQRLEMMVEDAGLMAAVVGEGQEAIVEWGECEVVRLEAEREEISRCRSERIESGVRGDNAAYVIYTSGSTGRPKGVIIEHRGISNRVKWIQAEMPMGRGDRLLQKTAMSFDASVWEIMVPLMTGARLILAEVGGEKDARYLIEEVKRQEVSVLQVVPTMMEAMLREGGLGGCESLRRVYCGGERLRKEVARKFAEEMREVGAELHNLYGPTEASIDATHWECGEEEGKGGVAIGRAIGNVKVVIVNERQRMRGIGVAGELCIGGVGLARGYVGRGDVTGERFVPEGKGGEAGARMYRTGDLAKQTSDGVIHYIGRIDHQIKLRGYRIELGEIEAVLSEHPAVGKAVVIDREDEAGNLQIVAYVVPDKDRVISATKLRAFAQEKLPDYMVPTAFVILDSLPLAPNGKLDRLALPPPTAVGPATGEKVVPPRNAVEKILAAIWAEVLGLKQVGVKNNFFDIGGHSLLATQMVSRVREAFGVNLKLRTLFEKPVLEDLAREIESKIETGERPQAPAIKPVSREGDLPLSFAQQRLWFIDQLEPGSPLYNAPTVAKLTGSLDVNALMDSLNEIIRRHESLRTVFASVGGSPVQVIKPMTGVSLKIIDLTDLKEAEKEQCATTIARQEARKGFDLEQGPLVRAALVSLSQSEHIALLTMHHIVSDGWSVGVMIKELGALYEAYAEGKPSPLEELEIQYADYAVWQTNWLEAGALRKQTDYWVKQLDGAPESLELPADRPRSASRGYNGSQERFQLSKEIAEGLNELSKREGATLFMTLLAAFQILLNRLSNQTDIVVGTDIANRHWAKVESLIGFFGNQLVLRANLSGNPTFRELLARAKDTTLEAYANQDMPFGKLVEVLNPNRQTGRTPLFQVKMVLQNAPTEPLTLPQLTMEILEDDNRIGVSRFDLLLTFVEEKPGLSGVIEYSADLFNRATITRMLKNLERLFESILAHPDASLDSLEIFTEAEIKERAMQKKKRQESSFEKFKSIKPKSLNLSPREFVKMSHLRAEGIPPMMIEPVIEGMNLGEWVGSNLSLVEENLLRHGALLFRGFNLSSQAHFEGFLNSTACRLMSYMEGATPRTKLSDKVYTSTEYPSDQHIALHNELTYVTTWPMKIYFFCLQPPLEGGQTPIADVRRVYNRISPRIRDRFAEKGWMLVRNFGQGLSLPWQTSFHTTDKAEAEAYFRGARIDWEWKADGGLRTRQVRPAIAQHPRTGEKVWFNHVAFWHVTSLEAKVRDSMLEVFKEEELPYNTYYGDGTAIEEEVAEEIREAYRLERQEYMWEAGDVLMLENMLVAHGRNPYRGPRRVLVAMGEASDATAE